MEPKGNENPWDEVSIRGLAAVVSFKVLQPILCAT